MKKRSLVGLIATIAVVAVIVLLFVNKNDSPLAVPVKTPVGSYVALGDSVAAGVGLKTYADPSACDRTTDAYPNVIANSLNYSLKTVACSGAATQAGLIGSQNVNKLALVPQIDTALAAKSPNLITMTVGINDTNWTSYIQKCYVSTCGTADDTAIVTSQTMSAAGNIRSALNQIKTKYPSSTPKVIMTGYYNLFGDAPTSDCTERSGIDASELSWIRSLQQTVNTSIESVASDYDFATFVPINFSGHELCSANPWIQGLNDTAPYHPTKSGQQAIADQLLTVIKKKGAAQ